MYDLYIKFLFYIESCSLSLMQTSEIPILREFNFSGFLVPPIKELSDYFYHQQMGFIQKRGKGIIQTNAKSLYRVYYPLVLVATELT